MLGQVLLAPFHGASGPRDILSDGPEQFSGIECHEYLKKIAGCRQTDGIPLWSIITILFSTRKPLAAGRAMGRVAGAN
jgi:hypothetical protein